MSQLGTTEEGQNIEGLFVTSSGNHSINAEMVDSDSIQSDCQGTIEVPEEVIALPSTSVDNTNRDLVI